MTDLAIRAPVSQGDLIAEKYRVERVLGQGGMGVVVAATHLHLGQRVAVKFLLPDACADSTKVARFLREARAAAQIQSEHVARVIDVGKLASGAPYIVMEYLSGSDLLAVLDSHGSLPVEDAVDYVLQACEAIAEAHAYGIVHRDLKPSNLFLTCRPDGSPLVKVLDFGVSKASTPDTAAAKRAALTTTCTALGSPLYMSPEQMRSAKTVDLRADIWSLGVILYELLTGSLVYEAESIPGLCAMVASTPAPPMRSRRPDLPEELDSVVLRCLEKDLTQRWQTVADLAVALTPFAPKRSRVSLERILGTELGAGAARAALPPSQPPPASPRPALEAASTADFGPTQPGRTPQRAWLVAAGALGLAAFAVLGWFGFVRGAETPRVAAPVVESRVPSSVTESQPAPPPALPVESLPLADGSAPRVEPLVPAPTPHPTRAGSTGRSRTSSTAGRNAPPPTKAARTPTTTRGYHADPLAEP